MREWLLSIDMKTKSCSACQEWVNKRVKEWESVRVREWIVEHRHENKSCSACQEWVNERVFLFPSFCMTFFLIFFKRNKDGRESMDGTPIKIYAIYYQHWLWGKIFITWPISPVSRNVDVINELNNSRKLLQINGTGGHSWKNSSHE